MIVDTLSVDPLRQKNNNWTQTRGGEKSKNVISTNNYTNKVLDENFPQTLLSHHLIYINFQLQRIIKLIYFLTNTVNPTFSQACTYQRVMQSKPSWVRLTVNWDEALGSMRRCSITFMWFLKTWPTMVNLFHFSRLLRS